MLKGTSKNRSYSSDATKLSANDSASFPFRFMDVHARAARDPHREQFFEVPLLFFFDTQRENPSNLSKHQCSFPLYCHGIRVSFFTPSWWIEINKSASRSLARFDRCSRLSCVFEPDITIICVERKPVLTSSSKTRRANFILKSYSFSPRALI